jgi:peroxiredoxin
MARRTLLAFAIAVVGAKGIKVGDKLPAIDLDSGFPPERVNMGKVCKGKKIVVVGLPGAFTPT